MEQRKRQIDFLTSLFGSTLLFMSCTVRILLVRITGDELPHLPPLTAHH